MKFKTDIEFAQYIFDTHEIEGNVKKIEYQDPLIAIIHFNKNGIRRVNGLLAYQLKGLSGFI